MIEKEEKDVVYLKKYLTLLIISGGIFWIIIGTLLILITYLLITYVPLEYLASIDVDPFIINIVYILGGILLAIGIFHFPEIILLRLNKPIARFLGIILGLSQIWIFPIGTYVGFLIFNETRNYTFN
ncbi:MAG: hypothetical protein ACTSYB_03665 [Candidatus Helarchaeota archaeon]